MSKTLAVILARQGSKSFPLKNLREVGGVSILGRAIQAALDAGIFDQIIVSTEGGLIANEARRYPGVTVVMRPSELANDTATSISGLRHALKHIGASEGEVVLLQPTSPLRTAKDIQQAHQQFIRGDAKCVISACLAEHHPYKTLTKYGTDGYAPVHQWESLDTPRQLLPEVVRINGAIYVNHVEDIMQYGSFFMNPIGVYLMSQESSIDIDSGLDLLIANQIMEYKT